METRTKARTSRAPSTVSQHWVFFGNMVQECGWLFLLLLLLFLADTVLRMSSFVSIHWSMDDYSELELSLW